MFGLKILKFFVGEPVSGAFFIPGSEIIFFLSKIPSYRGSLQPSKENI
jgi:hypothetical protein